MADLDFTTSARPQEILDVLAGWADAVWEVGIAFGTEVNEDGPMHHLTVYFHYSAEREPRSLRSVE